MTLQEFSQDSSVSLWLFHHTVPTLAFTSSAGVVLCQQFRVMDYILSWVTRTQTQLISAGEFQAPKLIGSLIYETTEDICCVPLISTLTEHKCPVVPPSHGLFSWSRQAVLDIQTLSAGLPYNTCRDFQKWPAWKRIQYVTKTPKNKLIKFNGNDTRNSCIISNWNGLHFTLALLYSEDFLFILLFIRYWWLIFVLQKKNMFGINLKVIFFNTHVKNTMLKKITYLSFYFKVNLYWNPIHLFVKM